MDRRGSSDLMQHLASLECAEWKVSSVLRMCLTGWLSSRNFRDQDRLLGHFPAQEKKCEGICYQTMMSPPKVDNFCRKFHFTPALVEVCKNVSKQKADESWTAC